MNSAYLAGKTVLVTGGTGSIGSEIVRQALQAGATAVRVYSRDEYRQMLLQEELGNDRRLRLLIGDVRDQERLAFAMSGVDIVFHAAAMKHVPACEYNPFEAVKTNVLGIQNVIDCAMRANAERMVTISTDKVVSPMNTMGATKLLGERLMMAANRYKGNRRTVFNCVRFGNVLGSRGSVVPLFRRQIRKGGPLTVTDARATRFFMSIPQAVELALKAGGLSRGGYTFVLKMPVVRIWQLAEVMAAEYAGRGLPLVDIRETGLRPGEKLFEELMTSDEAARAYESDDLFAVPSLLEPLPPPTLDDGWMPTQVTRYSSEDLPPLAPPEIRRMLDSARQLPASLVDPGDSDDDRALELAPKVVVKVAQQA
ncbi:UDP-N-acetylglucosamine 4,6-dehydratase family protein [Limnochorda pilosa]|uniref:Membrane protein n=1 Tax=Limnochorda pilosa TaxID=1555112 RepID=A0A0K2SN26_LIMPI|nr:UDP-N-acetylglucosamine 4,6-dehydratase family protein [Limnochorda pilosa]BAS28214.1 membrane protein [Limnochorda pilosa]